MALITRRRFVGGLAAGAGYLLVSPWVGPGLRGAAARSSVGPSGLPELSGTEFDLTMGLSGICDVDEIDRDAVRHESDLH